MSKGAIIWLMVLITIAVVCYVLLVGWWSRTEAPRVEVRTIERIDTVVFTKPVPVIAKWVRYEKVPQEKLRIDTINDTIAMSVPIEQKVYEDSAYRAYVSGYSVNLDSIEVYQRNIEVYRTEYIPEQRKHRISGGLQLGYGLTPKGLQPYVGLGLQLNF